MTYVLSYLVEEDVPVVIERPWWKFWGHDKVERVCRTQSVSFEVNEREASLLMDGEDLLKSAARSLFMKGVTKGRGSRFVARLQLEEHPGGTNYIKTSNPSGLEDE